MKKKKKNIPGRVWLSCVICLLSDSTSREKDDDSSRDADSE